MNGETTDTPDEGHNGYAPDVPTGTPWPCPYATPNPVTTSSGQVVCKTDSQLLPPTGGPDVTILFFCALLLTVAGLTTWAVAWARRDFRSTHPRDDEEVQS